MLWNSNIFQYLELKTNWKYLVPKIHKKISIAKALMLT